MEKLIMSHSVKFPETNHCLSRAHCQACRHDADFRAQLVEAFGEFECPLGIPLGAPIEELPTESKAVWQKICNWAEVVDTKVVACTHEKGLSIRKRGCQCCSDKHCKFYEVSK